MEFNLQSNENDFDLICEIAKKAEGLNLLHHDRMSMIMDLELAHQKFNLRLEEFLNADHFNFAHDILGIQSNIDRQNLKFDGFFLPRYTKPE